MTFDFRFSMEFDPTLDFEAFLASVPAKGAVYLLSDGDGRPFQLLSVKNLRASLANRLCEHPTDEKTRSIPYRQVVRKVRFCRVDSVAEAQWTYAQAARELFPQAYAKMMENWQAWYVSVDAEAKFPRWMVTDRPGWELRRTTFGPIATKSAAQKLVETLEDAFDLCRYHHILTQAPHGQACAYNQMHKCPAPCNGSISLGMYQQQIELSIAAVGSSQVIAEQEARMQQAAGALQFELAGKIRAFVEQLRSMTSGQCEHVRPIGDLRFCAVLRGGKAKAWKLMLMTPGAVEIVPEWTKVEEIADRLETFASRWEDGQWDGESFDRLTFVARQVMLKGPDCVLTTPDLAAIGAAASQLGRRKVDVETGEEGVGLEYSL